MPIYKNKIPFQTGKVLHGVAYFISAWHAIVRYGMAVLKRKRRQPVAEMKQMEEEQRWRLSRSERTLDCSISHMAWMAFRLQRLAEFSDRNTN